MNRGDAAPATWIFRGRHAAAATRTYERDRASGTQGSADEDDPETWTYADYGVNSFTSTIHCAGPQFSDDFDMVRSPRVRL